MASIRSPRLALALVLLSVSAPACFASSTAHDALERRVGTMERTDQERRRQLSAAMDRATTQVNTMNEQLEQARVQTRNLANLGARLDGLEEQLRGINGAIAEVRHTLETSTTEHNAQRTALGAQLEALARRITEIERRTGLAPAVDPNQIPSQPAEILSQAQAALAAREFNRARALANALLQRAPQDPLADDARLLVGRSQMQENRAASAVQEFQRLLTDYPNGDAVPAALTDMVEAFVRLGLCVPAQRTLRILIDRHGATPQGQAARRRLDAVRRLPRAACTG